MLLSWGMRNFEDTQLAGPMLDLWTLKIIHSLTLLAAFCLLIDRSVTNACHLPSATSTTTLYPTLTRRQNKSFPH